MCKTETTNAGVASSRIIPKYVTDHGMVETGLTINLFNLEKFKYNSKPTLLVGNNMRCIEFFLTK